MIRKILLAVGITASAFVAIPAQSQVRVEVESPRYERRGFEGRGFEGRRGYEERRVERRRFRDCRMIERSRINRFGERVVTRTRVCD